MNESMLIDTETKKRVLSILSVLKKPTKLRRFPAGFHGNPAKINLNQSLQRGFLLKYVLADIAGFPCTHQPIEKVAWEIDFIVNKIHCTISSEKFGYRLYIHSKDHAIISRLSKQLPPIFNKVVVSLQKHLETFSASEIEKGNIIVINQYKELFDMYTFFKQQAGRKRKFRDVKTQEKDFAKSWNRGIKAGRESFYFEQAAYFAFFGLLEHLLVLLLAFRNFNPKSDALKRFIFLKWSEKYKRIFDLSDKQFNEYYIFLTDLSRQNRNLYAHGKFSKDNSSMLVYLAGTGLISAKPFNFNGTEGAPLFRWLGGSGVSFQKLDNFLQLIKKHSQYKVPMQIICGGLNPDFSPNERREYKKLMRSGDASEFVEHTNDLIDRHQNMDW